MEFFSSTSKLSYKKKVLFQSLILLTSLLSLCITQEPRVERDEDSPLNAEGNESRFLTVQYKETESDPNLTSLDIYIPDSPGLHPVMVYVHGGGWRRGDKKNVDYKPDFFNNEGFVFVSVNYRLSPEVKHPTHVQDLADAVAWVAQHIGQYTGDPDAIFIMGHSAGAHLVSLVGTDEHYLKNAGHTLDILKGVISLDTGSLDIPLQVDIQRGFLAWVETAIGDDVEIWENASPIYHVEGGKGIPPYLLVYVSSREHATGVQAKNLQQEFEKEGLTCQVYTAKNKTHATVNRELGIPGDEPTERIMEFINTLVAEMAMLNPDYKGLH